MIFSLDKSTLGFNCRFCSIGLDICIETSLAMEMDINFCVVASHCDSGILSVGF